MQKVFISYRQTNDDQRKRVRSFAERLRDCGIEVVLDQFYLDAHPGGPPEGWDKWSSDSALKTNKVIIIGTESWFQCFEKNQPPGTGLGAACEADDLRHRIYKANGIVENIRVVLFDNADAKFISAKLERYHRFKAERDFNNIVRWLGGKVLGESVKALKTDIPHNLPRLQPFFGRENELVEIAKALDPKSRTWGALIDGDGGIGKTSLAIRAAYEVSPEHFDRIVFVSVKQHEQDDHRLRPLGTFALRSWLEMLNKIASELKLAEIPKSAEDERARRLQEELASLKILLVLDNLETLSDAEQDELFSFLEYLPTSCKALLTSRIFVGNKTLALDLKKLDQASALQMLEEIARHNVAFAKSSEAERISLYEQTGGNALLLRWVAGQVGHGYCTNIGDAVAHLRSCPAGNDPLPFIFDHVVESLDKSDVAILAALTWPTQPISADSIAEITSVSKDIVRAGLKRLINRTLVIAGKDETVFAPVPMVSDFLRKKKPDAISETGDRLENYVYNLILTNGYRRHDRYHFLDEAWSMIAAALQRFLAGQNERLQRVCNALKDFLNFSGRWDEWFLLSCDAEAKALAAQDFLEAGWKAHDVGCIHFLRHQPAEVLKCADRAKAHWDKGQAGIREQATAIRLRGLGYRLAKDFPAAILAYRQAVELYRALGRESDDVVQSLNSLANAEHLSGDTNSAERDYREALRMAERSEDLECIASLTINLAALAVDRKDWANAEVFTLKALGLGEKIGRQELIALACYQLALTFFLQGRKAEALPNARRAGEIYMRLGSPDMVEALQIAKDCEG